MLSLHNVSVEMAMDYFSNDDYYSLDSEDGRPEIQGKSARLLGIYDSKFDEEIFKNLLNGKSPDGERQIINVRKKKITGAYFAKKIEAIKSTMDSIGLSNEHKGFVKNSAIESLSQTKEQEAYLRNIWENGDSSDGDGKGTNPKIYHLDEPTSYRVRAELNLFKDKLKVSASDRIKLKKSLSKFISAISKSGHRAGTDATFSAPKSVSIAALVGGDHTLMQAHKDAVSYALDHLENRCAGNREGSEKNRFISHSGNIIAAKFLHGTSRAGDPQLHSHSVIFNMTKAKNGKWRALSNDEMYTQSKLLGCLYQNKLAEICQKNGYNIDVKKDGTFELKGYSDSQLRVFSKRRGEVLTNSARLIHENRLMESLKELGYTPRPVVHKDNRYFEVIAKSTGELEKKGFTAELSESGKFYVHDFIGEKSFEKQREKIIQEEVNQRVNRHGVLRNRKVKSDIKPEDLKEIWKKESARYDIRHPVKSKENPKIFGTELDNEYAIDHLSERKATYKSYELELQGVMSNLGKDTFEKITEKLSSNVRLKEVDLKDPNKFRQKYTNLGQLKKEEEVIQIALDGRGRLEPIASKWVADQMALENGYTKGQRDALTLSVTSKDQYILWRGVAGAGKSYALNHVRELAENSSINVIGLAPDATAAKELGSSIGAKARTIDSFLNSKKMVSQLKEMPCLLIIDEAGKMSTDKALKFQNAISGTKSRVIFVGDTRQFSAVEAGNPFHALANNEKISKAELLEHRRQKGSQIQGFEKIIEVFEGKLKGAGAGVDPYRETWNEVFQKRGKMDRTIDFYAQDGTKNSLNFEEFSGKIKQQQLKTSVDLASRSSDESLEKSFEKVETTISEKKSRAARINAVAKSYMQLSAMDRDSTLILSDKNSDRYDLIEKLREVLKKEGKIGKIDTSIRVLRDKGLTKAQLSYSRNFEKGDYLVVPKNDENLGLKGNEKYLVSAVKENVVHIKHGNETMVLKPGNLKDPSLFTEHNIKVSEGDKLQWRKNEHGRLNREDAYIASIKGSNILLRNDEGKVHEVSAKEPQHLDYGIVKTTYASQGSTVNRIIALMESSVSRESWYVGLSRAKLQASIITDDKGKLKERVKRYASQENALDFMNKKTGWDKGFSSKVDDSWQEDLSRNMSQKRTDYGFDESLSKIAFDQKQDISQKYKNDLDLSL